MADTERTLDYLLETVFKDGQSPNSINAQDLRDLIVSIKYLSGNGWSFHLDGQYTEGSPLTISAGVRTKVTIDGVAETLSHPNGVAFWNPSTNKIEPPAENDFGFARFALIGESTVAAVNRFEIELDVGAGTHPVIFQETGVFAKGAGNHQSFNFSIPLFAGPAFVANGGELYITPLEDATFWQFGLTAARTYLARPF